MKIKAKKNSIKTNFFYDYLLLGMIISIFLSLCNMQKSYLMQLIVGFVYIFIYKGKDNLNKISSFINSKKEIVMAFAVMIASCFLNMSSFTSSINNSIRVFSFLMLIISGYVFAGNINLSDIKIFKRFLILIYLSVIFGVYCYIVGYNPLKDISMFTITTDFKRINSIFVHPIPCSCFFVIGIVLSIFVIKNYYLKAITMIACFYGVVLTQSRSSWIIVLIVVSIIATKKMTKSNMKIKRNRFITILGIIALIIMLAIIFYSEVLELATLIMKRLFGKTLSQDNSYEWRVLSIQQILAQIRLNSVHTYFGHGFNAAANFMKDLNVSSKFEWNAATVDNAYITLLYDFGIVGFLLYVGLLIKTVSRIIKDKTDITLCIDCILIIILLFSCFFDAVYWASIFFILATMIGYRYYLDSNS